MNALATTGAMIIGVSVLLFLVNAVWALRRGALAGHNPWGAATLEWATSSPPPTYNFHPLPVVEGRSPLWDRSPEPPRVVGVRSDCREVLVTRVLDAEPDHKTELPARRSGRSSRRCRSPCMFVATIFTPWALRRSAAWSRPSLSSSGSGRRQSDHAGPAYRHEQRPREHAA